MGWGSPESFREAPLHRASSYIYHDLIGNTVVNQVKQMISEDRPITFAMNAGYYTFDNGKYIVTSLEYVEDSSLSHAQTVVGYDDTISEDGDVGAFRIVNSWGLGWGNGGYYWLTYAAFKEICAHPYQALTEVLDRADYVPSMLATLHFNDPPLRGSQQVESMRTRLIDDAGTELEEVVDHAFYRAFQLLLVAAALATVGLLLHARLTRH